MTHSDSEYFSLRTPLKSQREAHGNILSDYYGKKHINNDMASPNLSGGNRRVPKGLPAFPRPVCDLFSLFALMLAIFRF